MDNFIWKALTIPVTLDKKIDYKGAFNLEPNALVFFDLDGTLLNQHSQVNPEVASAIHQLRENGSMPIIATGRTNIEVDEIMEMTGINSIVSMNGQHVTFDGEEVYASVLETAVLDRLKEATNERNEGLSFYSNRLIRCTRHNELLEKAYNMIHSPIPQIDESIYHREDIHMALVLAEAGDEYYHREFPELFFIRNSPFSMDTIVKGGSKAKGIEALIERLNFQHIPTFAFGDGRNDMEMFGAVKHPIAMGNAISDLKNVAEFVTTSNVEGGIITGLKKYDLI